LIRFSNLVEIDSKTLLLGDLIGGFSPLAM
jgi:hypothetical protein